MKRGPLNTKNVPSKAKIGRYVALQVLDSLLADAPNVQKLHQDMQELFDLSPSRFFKEFVMPLLPLQSMYAPTSNDISISITLCSPQGRQEPTPITISSSSSTKSSPLSQPFSQPSLQSSLPPSLHLPEPIEELLSPHKVVELSFPRADIADDSTTSISSSPSPLPIPIFEEATPD